MRVLPHLRVKAVTDPSENGLMTMMVTVTALGVMVEVARPSVTSSTWATESTVIISACRSGQ